VLDGPEQCYYAQANPAIAYMGKINRITKRLVNNIFGVIGLRVERASSGVEEINDNKSSEDLLTQFFTAVALSGFTPKLIYDLGANRGVWTREVSAVFPAAKYVLFEPSHHLQSGLQSFVSTLQHAEVREMALSSQAGVATFSVSAWDVTSHLGSSNHPDETGYEVNVTTVDIQSAEDKITPDILKIDVEGEDLNVLIGAKSTLAQTSIVIIETGICYQAISNTALRVINALDEYGFDLMGITNLNPFQDSEGRYSPGIVWLADFAFLRRGTKVHQWFSNPSKEALNASWS
jgi:FkbM family methyltransferase